MVRWRVVVMSSRAPSLCSVISAIGNRRSSRSSGGGTDVPWPSVTNNRGWPAARKRHSETVHVSTFIQVNNLLSAGAGVPRVMRPDITARHTHRWYSSSPVASTSLDSSALGRGTQARPGGCEKNTNTRNSVSQPNRPLAAANITTIRGATRNHRDLLASHRHHLFKPPYITNNSTPYLDTYTPPTTSYRTFIFKLNCMDCGLLAVGKLP